MSWLHRASILALAAAALVSHADARVRYDWPIGAEREVDEGIYMKVLANRDGWRIWRTETEKSVECRAIKSGRGRPHPVPLGVGGAFFGGTPSLAVYRGYQDKLTFAWSADHYGKMRVKIRKPGAKFWTDVKQFERMPEYQDGAVLSVNATSWEYPEILVGYSEESTTIDLTGLDWAIRTVENCPGK